MGFMDKVKAQATQVAGKAQEGIKTGQAKVEEAQGRKKGDALLRELGSLVYAQRSGRAPEGSDADIDRIVVDLRALEEEEAALPVGAKANGSSETPQASGDFTLDTL
jgi:hypothetical protein